MSRRALGWVLLAVSLGACGGQTAASSVTLPPGPPESPVLFAAERDNSLFVVGARADAGTVGAFGLALPEHADTYEIQSLETSADGKRALVVLSPRVGTPDWTSRNGIVLLGDGSGWKVLDRGKDESVEKTSGDLSLVVAVHDCDATGRSFAVSVIQADGTHVYDNETCSAPFVYAVAPDGSYFVLQSKDGALTLHKVDGQQVVLAKAGQEAIVGSCFATSLIVADPRATRWVDTSGQPIDVPGWKTSVSTPSGLRVLNGGLYALEDRGLRRVADLPPGVDPSTIVDVRGGLVFVKKPGDDFEALDASGTVVASYLPAPEPPPRGAVGTPNIAVNAVAASTSSRDVWSVFADYYSTTSGESPDTYAGAEDLWVVVDGEGQVAPRTLSLRKKPGSAGFTVKPRRDYASSSSGGYVLYSESGALHALRVDSGADRKLASDFTIDSLGAITRHTSQ